MPDYSDSRDLQIKDHDDKAGLDLQPHSQAASVCKVWWKLDKWILPLLFSFHFLCGLDRTNIANARIAGLQRSLSMSNYQFTLALTVTSIFLVISGFPSTLLLKHVGPNLMLPGMAVLWGVASATQGFTSNYSELLVCRAFLGFFEGGLSPGILLYLSFFYPRDMLQTRLAAMLVLASMTSSFSGMLATVIDNMDGVGGKHGWAWMFILEGTFTVTFGMISFLLLPRAPEKARFFTEEEQAYVIATLKHSGSVSEDDNNDRFSWVEVVRAVQSPHVWTITVAHFFNVSTVAGLTYFGPTIITDLGYAGHQAQLMSIPPHATSFILTVISAIVSDRYQCRGYTTIFFSLLSVIGFAMFYVSTSNHVRYASLFFSISGGGGAMPALSTWLSNNTAPHARRATAVAIVAVIIPWGAVLSYWLFGWISPAPDYTLATIVFICMSVSITVLSTINVVYLSHENQIKAERRQRMSKGEEPEDLGDRSAWFIYSL